MNAQEAARWFVSLPPDWRAWVVIVGAGLKCGALTEAEVRAAESTSDDPLKRACALHARLTARQLTMIHREFAKVPLWIGQEGHA